MPLQFTVPQFLDVEDKIFGPISVRQFIILLVAGVMAVVIYRLFGSINFFITAALDAGILIGAILLSFVRIQGIPLHQFLLHYLQTAMQPRLRVWSPEEKRRAAPPEAAPKPGPAPKAPLTRSRLTELSILIDTGGAYPAEEELFRTTTTPAPTSKPPPADQ